MVERVTSEAISVDEFAPDGMSSGEASASYDDHCARIASEVKIDRRSAPHASDDASREDGAAQVDVVVIAIARPHSWDTTAHPN